MAAGRKTGGRVAGTPNKVTADLRDMILGALADAGGQKYLADQAVKSPGAFMTLVGKVLPTQIAGTAPDGAIHMRYSWAKPEPPPVDTEPDTPEDAS